MRHLISLSILTIIIFTLLITGCKYATVTGGPLDHIRLTNGIFEGHSSYGPNSAQVKIIIENQKLVTVKLLSHDAWKGHKADTIIPERIVKAQSTQVDAVTGATNSSRVIMNAVEDAIQKAYRTEANL